MDPPLTPTSPVLITAAICTGEFKFYEYKESTGEIRFSYIFRWSHQPNASFTDVIGVSWNAIDAYAYTINCSATNRDFYVHYYEPTTDTYYKTIHYTTSPMSGFDGYQATYDSAKAKDIIHEDDVDLGVYGKHGAMMLTLKPDGNNTINKLKVYGAIGHKVINLSWSIGFSAGTEGAWSFQLRQL